jgi:hypothetical protein
MIQRQQFSYKMSTVLLLLNKVHIALKGQKNCVLQKRLFSLGNARKTRKQL